MGWRHGVFVHGHSLDVPVTVPSADTRTWGGGMGCSSTDILWTSQLLCHPRILGHGMEAWGVRPRIFPGRPSYCAIHDTRTWDGGMGCSSTDIPWTSQLLCHPRILGHGMEAWGVRPQTFPGRPSYCAIHGY